MGLKEVERYVASAPCDSQVVSCSATATKEEVERRAGRGGGARLALSSAVCREREVCRERMNRERVCERAMFCKRMCHESVCDRAVRASVRCVASACVARACRVS